MHDPNRAGRSTGPVEAPLVVDRRMCTLVLVGMKSVHIVVEGKSSTLLSLRSFVPTHLRV